MTAFARPLQVPQGTLQRFDLALIRVFLALEMLEHPLHVFHVVERLAQRDHDVVDLFQRFPDRGGRGRVRRSRMLGRAVTRRFRSVGRGGRGRNRRRFFGRLSFRLEGRFRRGFEGGFGFGMLRGVRGFRFGRGAWPGLELGWFTPPAAAAAASAPGASSSGKRR